MTFNKASNSAVSALCTAGDSAWAIASTSRITRGHDVKNVEALTTFDRKRPTDFTGDRSSSTCMQVIFFTPPPPPSRASQRPHQRSLPQAYPRHTSTERSTTCKSGPHSGTLSCTTHQLAYHASEDSALVRVRDEFSFALSHTLMQTPGPSIQPTVRTLMVDLTLPYLRYCIGTISLRRKAAPQ